MEQLKAKLKKQGGFTMVELLIVVAIIAILVAVSIPMMNQALEKSRHAVDQANVRDAIGLALVEYSVNPDDFSSTSAVTYTYCVDDESIGYLMKSPGTNDKGAIPKCTCSKFEDTDVLTVSIKAPADPKADGAKPEIETSWRYDTASKVTTKD